MDPLKKYRRQLRIWRNDRRLQREQELYEREFAAQRLVLPNEEAIRRHIRKKFPLLKPKKKGSLQILTVYHHYNWEDESLRPSLEKFGPVRHYDWVDRFDHRQEKEWHRSVKEAMNRDLLDWAARNTEEAKADVIFSYLSGELISPEAVRELSCMGIPMINLALNDKELFAGKIRNGLSMGNRDICRWFTLSWTSTEDALKKYCVEGALPIYLPEGANPEIHRPYDLEKTIPVSFVGQCYGNRPAIIARLLEAGIHVEAYGAGWPNGSLSTEDMVRLYSKSRINLGFGSVIGFSDAYCLKGRDFEIPMSGGLYLTEHHPELERVYEIGKEIVTYRGFEDLLKKIRYLLDNPTAAGAIRQQGFERAHRDHSWEMRFEKVFNIIGLI
ncbi:MAG: glycosyltransferase [Deltaproteobacteria bacterium]|nr:glycosyltransferase [Deltaproteobacteria bacterium]